jgi:hypothetical protein
MGAFLRLARLLNLPIIAFTMVAIRYGDRRIPWK